MQHDTIACKGLNFQLGTDMIWYEGSCAPNSAVCVAYQTSRATTPLSRVTKWE